MLLGPTKTELQTCHIFYTVLSLANVNHNSCLQSLHECWHRQRLSDQIGYANITLYTLLVCIALSQEVFISIFKDGLYNQVFFSHTLSYEVFGWVDETTDSEPLPLKTCIETTFDWLSPAHTVLAVNYVTVEICTHSFMKHTAKCMGFCRTGEEIGGRRNANAMMDVQSYST